MRPVPRPGRGDEAALEDGTAAVRLPGLPPATELPGIGALIPDVALRAGLVVVAGLLSLADFGSGYAGWIVVGTGMGVVAAAYPRYMFGWVLIVFLALGQAAHRDDLSWRLLVLLAGLHLVHVLAALALELPTRSWLAPAVLVAPLRRWVVIQVPVQLLAVVALSLLAPSAHGHRPLTVPVVSVIGAVALAGLALLLVRPRRGDQGRSSPRAAAGE